MVYIVKLTQLTDANRARELIDNKWNFIQPISVD